MARDRNGESYRLIKLPKYKHDQYTVFGSYNAAYRRTHFKEDGGIPRAPATAITCWLYNARRTIQNRNMNWHWRMMDPGGHDLNNIPMFLDTMWRGGGPCITATTTRSWPATTMATGRAPARKMMHFAFDRHAGGIQGVFLDHSVQHIPIKKLWRLKWHRQFDTGKKMNWPRWMAGYRKHN